MKTRRAPLLSPARGVLPEASGRAALLALAFLLGRASASAANAAAVRTAGRGCSGEGCVDREDGPGFVATGAAAVRPQRPTLRDVDFGAPQSLPPYHDVTFQRVRRALFDSIAYMERVHSDPSYDGVRDLCVNHSEDCTSWAAVGLCERNAPFTPLFCGPACQDCDVHDVEKRCPVDPDGADALGPGDVNALFGRIVSDPELRRRYRPRALSRPPDGPWVVELPHFLESDECDRLIAHGHAEGYERSLETGPVGPGGSRDGVVSEARTSSTSWCESECEDDPAIEEVTRRMADVVGLPWDNAEYLQLLRYQRGERYVEHHDYVSHEASRPYGVRVLTAYLYLNDVEAGGGTRFPQLGPVGNLTVYPEKGKMLVWANVQDEDPCQRDDRTMHEALPVERGEKYGSNVWWHMRDFREPMQRFCHL